MYYLVAAILFSSIYCGTWAKVDESFERHDITHCANEIIEKCPVNEYFISTLEIIERELVMNRGKVDEYFTRQVCKNSIEDLLGLRKCVIGRLGEKCWRWDGVFDKIRILAGERNVEMANKAKRFEQAFVIIEYDLCHDEALRAEYFDIRACSHKRLATAGVAFHEHFTTCIDSKEPNAIEEAMDRMDLCRGHNRQYSCFVDALLGEHCDKVRQALLTYAGIHAGHSGVHEDELKQIQFILRSAYSDHLRLPKHEECHLIKTTFTRDGAGPSYLFIGVVLVSFCIVGALVYYFKNDIMGIVQTLLPK